MNKCTTSSCFSSTLDSNFPFSSLKFNSHPKLSGLIFHKSFLLLLLLFCGSQIAFSQAFDLDQGENGGKSGQKPITPVSPVHWVNANLGASNAHFMEGYSVPYSTKLTNLTASTDYVIRIGFDIRVGGKWALDYITGPRNYFDHDFF